MTAVKTFFTPEGAPIRVAPHALIGLVVAAKDISAALGLSWRDDNASAYASMARHLRGCVFSFSADGPPEPCFTEEGVFSYLHFEHRVLSSSRKRFRAWIVDAVFSSVITPAAGEIHSGELVHVSTATVGGETVPSVNARDLHGFLGVGAAFKDWIIRRIQDFGFIEDQDFRSFLSESSGGRPAKEYALTLSMAKELAMVERNERGKQARLYFIECERRAKAATTMAPQVFQIPKSLPEALRLAADLADQRDALVSRVEAMVPKEDFHDAVRDSADGISVRAFAQLMGTGQIRMFQWLRGQGFLLPNNTPYQSLMDRGYFRVIENRIETNTHGDLIKPQTLITGKGQIWLQKRWSEAKPLGSK